MSRQLWPEDAYRSALRSHQRLIDVVTTPHAGNDEDTYRYNMAVVWSETSAHVPTDITATEVSGYAPAYVFDLQDIVHNGTHSITWFVSGHRHTFTFRVVTAQSGVIAGQRVVRLRRDDAEVPVATLMIDGRVHVWRSVRDSLAEEDIDGLAQLSRALQAMVKRYLLGSRIQPGAAVIWGHIAAMCQVCNVAGCNNQMHRRGYVCPDHNVVFDTRQEYDHHFRSSQLCHDAETMWSCWSRGYRNRTTLRTAVRLNMHGVMNTDWNPAAEMANYVPPLPQPDPIELSQPATQQLPRTRRLLNTRPAQPAWDEVEPVAPAEPRMSEVNPREIQ